MVLRAADPAALERFYVDVLGCTVEKRQEAIALTQLRAGRTLIDIIPAAKAGPAAGEQSGRGANLDHLCLRIEPFDAAAIQQAFRRARVTTAARRNRASAPTGRGLRSICSIRKATASSSRVRRRRETPRRDLKL